MTLRSQPQKWMKRETASSRLLTERVPLVEGEKLNPDFYTDRNVLRVSRNLLGKVLCTFIDNQFTAGIIVETEAYSGKVDGACHAHMGRRTGRNQIMYSEGGVAYVYLCYGLHHLFNIVTNVAHEADAVLIRALEPLEGIDLMLTRRKKARLDSTLTMGPGSLSMAMGIGKNSYGQSLQGPDLWVEDRYLALGDEDIARGPRIGVDYAGEDALLPWRFFVRGNPHVTKPRTETVLNVGFIAAY